MTATARYEFSSASYLMHSLMIQFEEDCQALSRSSSEKYQVMREKLLKTWQDWPQIRAEFEQALQSLPRELRRRDFVVNAQKQIEQFEVAAKSTLAEFSNASREAYRSTVSPRIETFAARIATLRADADALSERLTALQQHPLIEKFLRGEPILASRSKIQWGRKIGHMLLGLLFLYLFVYSGLSRSTVWTVYVTFMIWGFSLETARHVWPKVNDWVCVAFGPVMREREKHKINSAIFYMASMSIVFFLCPLDVAMLTMLFIAVGDPVAGIVGIRFGKHKISQHSSLEGTFACFALCAMLAMFSAAFMFTTYHLSGLSIVVFGIVSGMIGAVAESSFKKLDDNLVMPLLSAPAIWILLSVLG